MVTLAGVFYVTTGGINWTLLTFAGVVFETKGALTCTWAVLTFTGVF